VDIQTSKANTRTVEIYNGNLMMGTASTAGTPNVQGIYQFSGEPTTAQALSSPIVSTNTGSGDGMNDFAVNPAGTTLYFADDRSPATIVGGVQRWDFDGVQWTNTYNLTNGLGNTTTRSLTVDWSGPKPVIYATTSQASQNKLVTVTDNGSTSPYSTLATAGPNQLFRGVKFGPAAAVVANPPTITSTVLNGSNLILSGSGGTPSASYYVLTSADVAAPMSSWTSIATNTFDGSGNFSFTNSVTQPALFYRIQVP
jgi:hypothetical protein